MGCSELKSMWMKKMYSLFTSPHFSLIRMDTAVTSHDSQMVYGLTIISNAFSLMPPPFSQHSCCTALSIASRLYHRGNARFTVRRGRLMLGRAGITISFSPVFLKFPSPRSRINWGGIYVTNFSCRRDLVSWLSIWCGWWVAIGGRKQTDD